MAGNRSILGFSSPKLGLKRSFTEQDQEKGGKSTMRNRLLPNDSGYLSSGRGKTLKLLKGVDGSTIATIGHSNVLLENKTMVKMLRINAPETFNIFAEAAYTKKPKVKALKSLKLVKMNIVLADGKLTLRQNEQNSPSRRKLETAIHNMCCLHLQKEKKMISFQSWVKLNGNDDKKETDFVITCIIKLGSERQAEFIAEKLIHECVNFGIVLDLHLGYFNVNGIKPEIEPHLGDLIRKRYALFAISKPRGSAARSFALDQLIAYLSKNDHTKYEAKFWKARASEGAFNLLSGSNSNGLEDILLANLEKFKDNRNQLEESIGAMFFSVESSQAVTDSYYIVQHVEGKLAECD